MEPLDYLADMSRAYWPELHPGMYVEWRERLGDPWERVFVNTVVHEYDQEAQNAYTIVMVALLDGQGRRTQGMRTANGVAIATCIRASR